MVNKPRLGVTCLTALSLEALGSASGYRNANSDKRAKPFPRNVREGNLAVMVCLTSLP
jgi:hypothetical protein